MDADVRGFLLGLRELSLRYGVVVEGCGCCGSPWVERVEVGVGGGYFLDDRGKNLSWVSPEDGWRWKEYGGGVVR